MKKLRHLLTLVICLVIATTAATSCKKSPEALAKQRIEENVIAKASSLPAALSDGSELVKLSYDGKTLYYICAVDSKRMAKIKKNKTKEAQKTLDNLKSNNAYANLIRDLVTSSSAVQFEYCCDNDTIVFNFTPNALAN